MKESYRENLASSSGLEPYAGSGNNRQDLVIMLSDASVSTETISTGKVLERRRSKPLKPVSAVPGSIPMMSIIDGIHYTTAGYKDLGKRFTEKAIFLIKKHQNLH